MGSTSSHGRFDMSLCVLVGERSVRRALTCARSSHPQTGTSPSVRQLMLTLLAVAAIFVLFNTTVGTVV